MGDDALTSYPTALLCLLLTCEPAGRGLDRPEGMSSCKLRLHRTLCINLSRGVMGANPNTDREGPPSSLNICQIYSTEQGRGSLLWIIRGEMVSRAMFGPKCSLPVAGQVSAPIKPDWLTHRRSFISAQSRLSKPIYEILQTLNSISISVVGLRSCLSSSVRAKVGLYFYLWAEKEMKL